MDGFAEKGAPADWDTALGKVHGYRVWTLRLSLRSPSAFSPAYRDRTLNDGWGKGRNYHLASVLPVLSQSYVEGLYGGHWNYRHQREGWYHANCAASTRVRVPSIFSNVLDDFGVSHHPPPLPDCGCGFWAYWDSKNSSEFGTQRPWIKKIDYLGYEVLIPLSGVIDGSGPTIIGDRGFRTARARITHLAIPATDSCIYEEEAGHSYDPAFPVFASGGPIAMGGVISAAARAYSYPVRGSYLRQQEVPFISFLADITGVPQHLVQETVSEVVSDCLGNDFTWHDSANSLIAACPPDENYGGNN